MKHFLFSLLLFVYLSFGLTSYAMNQDNSQTETATAVFAGGCFWCLQPPFDKVEGVIDTEVGYSGGTIENPTYEQVVRENTGHLEVFRVTYDPQMVSYEELLRVFWRNVDPLDGGGQFCDRGESYTSAIFVANEAERSAAEKSLAALPFPRSEVKTVIRDAAPFYVAEDYHQDYYQKNPIRYKFYRYRCGRDQRLEELWGQ